MRPTTAAAERYARAKLPAAGTPWRRAHFGVVDLETTGLEPRHDEIVSFAMIPVDEGRVRPGGVVTTLVHPRRMPAPDSIRIHGLRAADLEHAPPLGEALDDLLSALSGRILVAHFARIERSFLGGALRSQGASCAGGVIDTARLARAVLGREAVEYPLGLGDLATRLGLPVHRPHHAEGDALTTAQAFIALAGRLERKRGPQTVRSLKREGGAGLSLR